MMTKNTIDLVGYQLHDMNTHWELHFKYGIFKGNLKQVTTYAVLNHRFSVSEIEFALVEMNENLHDMAEFGIMRTFIFSSNRKQEKVS